MQHVFSTTTSASSSPDAADRPSASRRPAMRSESCSFIWHPKVLNRYLRAIPAQVRRGAAVVGIYLLAPRKHLRDEEAPSGSSIVELDRLVIDGIIDELE